jgi:hypothetical protein
MGWKRVFDACGHDAVVWRPLATPAFDVFDEVNPHLFVRTVPDDRATAKCVASRPQMKVVDRLHPVPAGDTFLFYPDKPDPNLVCDFAYIGEYRPDKQALLNTYLLPLSSVGTLKIFGSGPWPTPDYLGPVTDETARRIYASAKLCIDIPSTKFHHDRSDNVSLCDGICVDCNRNELNPEEFLDLVRKLKEEKSVEWWQETVAASRHMVLQGSTYWHKVYDILRSAELYSEADRIMERFRATVRL